MADVQPQDVAALRRALHDLLGPRPSAARRRQLAASLRELADEQDRLAEAVERSGTRVRAVQALAMHNARRQSKGGRPKGTGARFLRFVWAKEQERRGHFLHIGRALWQELEEPKYAGSATARKAALSAALRARRGLHDREASAGHAAHRCGDDRGGGAGVDGGAVPGLDRGRGDRGGVAMIRDYQDYRRHRASDEEPWWSEIDSSEPPRYERARRLTQFRLEIAHREAVRLSARRLAYRQACLHNWRAYLDGWTPRDEVAKRKT